MLVTPIKDPSLLHYLAGTLLGYLLLKKVVVCFSTLESTLKTDDGIAIGTVLMVP